jgi:PPE-repeat protein
MDYGALPPEINSARMYLGPGSAPMLVAAAAWGGLAAELGRTAASYQSVIDGLAGEGWLGPASASMAAAVTPYLTWMSLTGLQAEHAASQASAAAGAFEAAFAMTVPPAEVAANRTQLMALIATNFLGVNMPAIAATEAQYGEMWAQDAAAMYGYAASSAIASTLTPFAEPPDTTNPAGVAGQATAAAQATTTAAGTGTQTVDQLMSAIPAALQGFSSPVSAASNPALAIPGLGSLDGILNFLDGADGSSIGTFLNSSLVNGLVSAGYVSPAVIEPGVTAGISDINAVAVAAQPGATALPPMGSGAGNPGWLPLLTPGTAGLSSMSGPDLGGVSAGTNQAALVGRLSVPQSWTAAAQVENHAGAALPGAGWTSTALPESPAGMPGMPGVPVGNTAGRHFGSGPRYGFQVTVMPRPPAAG